MPMVNDMLVDQKGYMWLATFGGLARFDGITFSNFEPQGKGSKTINFKCLALDENGNLWTVGMDDRLKNQLFIFNTDDNRFDPISSDQKPDLPPAIRALVPYSPGEFYMITENEEIFKYKKGEINFLFQTPDQIPIRNLKQEASELLIVDANQEIYKLAIQNQSNPYIQNKIETIYPPPANVPNLTEVTDLKNKQVKPYRLLSATPSLFPRPVFPFEEPIWFYHWQSMREVFWALNKKELHVYATKSNTWSNVSYLLEDYPKSQSIKCSLIDQYNQLWIGTNDGVFSITSFIPFAKTMFAGRDIHGNAFSFRGITKWRGEIYANSYSGKVRFDSLSGNESYFFLSRERGHLLAAHSGINGSLWMGNGRQLQRFSDPDKPPRIYRMPLIPDMPSEALEIWEIYEDTAGKVWLGTSVGLAVWLPEEEKITYLPTNPGEHPSDAVKIHHILPLQNGLALATSNGFSYYDFENGFNIKNGEYFQLMNQTSGISIYHICLDEYGDFWLATHGKGLLQWEKDEATIHQFDSSFGFSNENLHSVYADERDGLWISSEDGLFLFDKKEKRAGKISPNLGFGEKEFSRLAHYKDESGNLYFGGIAGISFFHPANYYSSIPRDTVPLHWQSVKLSAGLDGSIQEIASLIKMNETIPFPIANSKVEIGLTNLGRFETFEYKWKSDGEVWNKSNLSQIYIQNLPEHSDELLIRAFGEYGLVSEILAIPFHWEHRNPLGSYLAFGMIGSAILLIGYYFIGIRRGKGLLISTKIGNWREEIKSAKTEQLIQATDDFVDRLDQVILHHLSTPEFGVNELSDAFCISRKSLYRKVKQHTGQNPNEYIRNYRLEYARKLLEDAELNISDITFKAGFSSTSYFSNCYKKHFGISPKEDRKRLNAGNRVG